MWTPISFINTTPSLSAEIVDNMQWSGKGCVLKYLIPGREVPPVDTIFVYKEEMAEEK